MARNLTQWEKKQIKDIDNLIENCKLIYFEFQSECRQLTTKLNTSAPNVAETLKNDLKESMPQRLRSFAIDLYSALDFLCCLCYGHFKNNGNNPSDSPEIRDVNFPYTKKLKKSDVDGQEVSCRRRRGKFVWDNFRTILTCFQPDEFGPQDASTQERYDRFEEIILNCQVITNIGADGQPLQQQDQMEEAATCFNTLHYLRNTNIHRNLVDIEVCKGWWYVNWADMSQEYVRERIPARDNDPCWCSIPCWFFWIAIPSFMEGMETEKTPRQLLSVTRNILDFVINTKNELLEIAFPHVDGPAGDIPKIECHKVCWNMQDIHDYITKHYTGTTIQLDSLD